MVTEQQEQEVTWFVDVPKMDKMHDVSFFNK